MAVVEKFLASSSEGPQKFAIILAQEAGQLLTIDRYDSPGGNLPFEPSMRRAEDPMIAIIGATTHSCVTLLAERSQNAQSFQLGQISFSACSLCERTD
jgi:hypothetical protein